MRSKVSFNNDSYSHCFTVDDLKVFSLYLHDNWTDGEYIKVGDEDYDLTLEQWTRKRLEARRKELDLAIEELAGPLIRRWNYIDECLGNEWKSEKLLDPNPLREIVVRSEAE